jgi:hypothetical protein
LRVLGPEHPDTLTSMCNLAHMMRHMGAWLEARELTERVLAVRLQVLGPEHPDIQTIRDTLAEGNAARGQGRPQSGEPV